jgi:hypothetical protein
MNLQIISQSSAESELTGRLLLSKLGAENNSEYSACGSTITEDLPDSVDHHHHHHQAMSEAATHLLPTATIPTAIMSNNLVSKTRNTHAQPRVGNQAKSMEPPAQEGSNNTPAHLEFDEGRKEIRAIVSKLSELGILRHSAGGLKATEAELANTQSSYYLLPPLPAHMAKLLCAKSTHKKTETQNSVEAVNHSSKEKHDAMAPDNAMEKGVLSSQAAVADTARNEAPGAMLEPKSQLLTEMLRHGEESQLSTSGDNLTAAANELGVKRAASHAADQAGEQNLLQGQAGVMNENLQCTEDKSSKTLRDIIKPCSSNVMKEPTIASGPQYRKPPQEDQMHIDNQGEVTTQIIELVNELDVKTDQEKQEIVDDGSSCKPVGIPAYIAEEGEIIEDGVLMKAAGETTILKHGLVSEDSVRRTSGGATIKNVSEDGSDTNPPRPLAAVGKDDTLTTAAMLPPQIMAGKQHGDHQSSERAVVEHHKLMLPHYPHHAGLETENRYTVKQLLLPQAAASGGYHQPCEMFKHAQQQRSGVLQTLYDSHETMSHQAAAAAEELWRLHLYNQRRQQQFAPPLTSCNHQLPAAAASQPQSSSSSDAARCGNPKTNVGCDSPPEKEALVAADASRPTAAAGCSSENNNVVASEDSRPLLPDPAYATHAAAVAAVARMPNLPEYWLQYQRRFLKTQQADVARDDGAAASHLQPHLASSDRSSDGVQSRKAENLVDPSGRLPLLQWPHRLLPSNNKPLFSPRPHLQQHRASSQSSSSQQPWLQGGTHHRRGGTSSSSTRIPGGPHHFSNNTHGGQQPTSRGGQQVHRKPGVTRAPGGVTRPQFPRQLLLQEHHHHRGVLGYPTHLFHQALLQQMIALQAADAHQTTAAAVGCPRHWRRIKRDFTARGDSSSSSSAPPYQPQQVWQQQHGGQSRRSQSSTSVYTYRSQNSNNSGWDQTTARHDHEEKEQRVAANSSYSSNESAQQQQQQFEKDQQINQQPAAAAASQPIMQHHTLRFPPNMKWQRVPNDRNSLQTLVKTPGNIPDEETLQSKHIATAWYVVSIPIPQVS